MRTFETLRSDSKDAANISLFNHIAHVAAKRSVLLRAVVATRSRIQLYTFWMQPITARMRIPADKFLRSLHVAKISTRFRELEHEFVRCRRAPHSAYETKHSMIPAMFASRTIGLSRGREVNSVRSPTAAFFVWISTRSISSVFGYHRPRCLFLASFPSPSSNRFRHWRWLSPDDALPQNPSGILHCDCDAPRNSNKISRS